MKILRLNMYRTDFPYLFHSLGVKFLSTKNSNIISGFPENTASHQSFKYWMIKVPNIKSISTKMETPPTVVTGRGLDVWRTNFPPESQHFHRPLWSDLCLLSSLITPTLSVLNPIFHPHWTTRHSPSRLFTLVHAFPSAIPKDFLPHPHNENSPPHPFSMSHLYKITYSYTSFITLSFSKPPKFS